MWLMLQQETPSDYVIATGYPHKLETFVSTVFDELKLDWHKHVDIDSTLFRPSEISYSLGDPSKAFSSLGWKARVSFSDLIKKLVI
jgi:GDPmannose 4,6-dehydratase